MQNVARSQVNLFVGFVHETGISMFSSITISQHYIKESGYIHMLWDPEQLPDDPKLVSKEYLFLTEQKVKDLVDEGFASNECLPYTIDNFYAVAFTLKHAEKKGLIDYVFFYSETESEIDLGPGLGIVKIHAEEDYDANEADYANVSAMFSHGFDLMRAGNEELAEKYWRKGADFKGEDFYDQKMNCYDFLGVMLGNQGRTEEALEFWVRGLWEYTRAGDFRNRLLEMLKTEDDEGIKSRIRKELEATKHLY